MEKFYKKLSMVRIDAVRLIEVVFCLNNICLFYWMSEDVVSTLVLTGSVWMLEMNAMSILFDLSIRYTHSISTKVKLISKRNEYRDGFFPIE